MASAVIGALRVTLGLDTANFEAGTKRARGQAKSAATDINKALGVIGAGAAAVGVGALAAQLGRVAKQALDYASSLGEVAQQLGVTTRDLQAYRYAASQAGVSQDEMDAGLARLTLSIGEAAAGSKVQATAFRELGVSVTDANGNMLTAGEVIPRIADGLAKIKDPATRARLELDLFGKAGQKLDPLLSQGSQGVNALRDAAERLGIVLSDEQIQKADETADKLAAVKMVLDANIASVVADNSTAILNLATSLGELASQIPDAYNRFKRFALFMGEVQARFANNITFGLFGDDLANRLDAEQKRITRDGRQSAFDAKFGYGPGKLFGDLNPRQRSIGDLPSISSGGGARKSRSPTVRREEDVESAASRRLTEVSNAGRDIDSLIASLTDSLVPAETLDALMASVSISLGMIEKADVADAIKLEDLERMTELGDQLAFVAEDALGALAGINDLSFSDIFKQLQRLAIQLLFIEPLVQSIRDGAGNGGGLSGAVQGAGAFFKSLPGFADGGSFKVGGVPGVDRNLVQFRATRGEMVDIRTPGQQRSGRPVVFDLRGAVMTEDLLRQMNAIGDGASVRGAQMALRAGAQQQRQSLGL